MEELKTPVLNAQLKNRNISQKQWKDDRQRILSNEIEIKEKAKNAMRGIIVLSPISMSFPPNPLIWGMQRK